MKFKTVIVKRRSHLPVFKYEPIVPEQRRLCLGICLECARAKLKANGASEDAKIRESVGALETRINCIDRFWIRHEGKACLVRSDLPYDRVLKQCPYSLEHFMKNQGDDDERSEATDRRCGFIT